MKAIDYCIVPREEEQQCDKLCNRDYHDGILLKTVAATAADMACGIDTMERCRYELPSVYSGTVYNRNVSGVLYRTVVQYCPCLDQLKRSKYGIQSV